MMVFPRKKKKKVHRRGRVRCVAYRHVPVQIELDECPRWSPASHKPLQLASEKIGECTHEWFLLSRFFLTHHKPKKESTRNGKFSWSVRFQHSSVLKLSPVGLGRCSVLRNWACEPRNMCRCFTIAKSSAFSSASMCVISVVSVFWGSKKIRKCCRVNLAILGTEIHLWHSWCRKRK